MSRILRLTRNAPNAVRLTHAHMPGAAGVAADRARVTREEISHLFRYELGYSLHPGR